MSDSWARSFVFMCDSFSDTRSRSPNIVGAFYFFSVEVTRDKGQVIFRHIPGGYLSTCIRAASTVATHTPASPCIDQGEAKEDGPKHERRKQAKVRRPRK